MGASELSHARYQAVVAGSCCPSTVLNGHTIKDTQAEQVLSQLHMVKPVAIFVCEYHTCSTASKSTAYVIASSLEQLRPRAVSNLCGNHMTAEKKLLKSLLPLTVCG